MITVHSFQAQSPVTENSVVSLFETVNDWNTNSNNNNNDESTMDMNEDVDEVEIIANNEVVPLYELCLSLFSRMFDRNIHKALSDKFDACSVINLSN